MTYRSRVLYIKIYSAPTGADVMQKNDIDLNYISEAFRIKLGMISYQEKLFTHG